jgi:hypothetical protein
MKGMYDFLSRGFACLAVALVIVSVLAMPTQVVLANDPSPDGGTADETHCQDYSAPWDCPVYRCLYSNNTDAGYNCDGYCGCGT